MLDLLRELDLVPFRLVDQEASASIRTHGNRRRNGKAVGTEIPAQRLCVAGGKSDAIQTIRQSLRRRRQQLDVLRVIGIKAHARSEEHTSELQSLRHLVCRLLLEKK